MRLNTINEVAQRLAVSSPTVRRLIARAELPTVRVGRCLRLRDDDVEALLRRGYTGCQPSQKGQGSRSVDDGTSTLQERVALEKGRANERATALAVEKEHV
jgi:excisionase family DNA binding protein